MVENWSRSGQSGELTRNRWILDLTRVSRRSEDVGFGDDEEFLAVELDFGAAVFGDEDAVAHLDGELDVVAFVILAAGAEATTLASWVFPWRYRG